MNHGTVKAEISEYRDHGARVVVCELADGWHVVECYVPRAKTERYVCESLSDARAWAYDWLERRAQYGPFNVDPDPFAEIRDDAGNVPAYAWPGGYPLVYVCDDGEVLCADCVNDTSNPVHFGGEADGWRLEGYQTHWEGPAEQCAHCRKEIPSAYGDPDKDAPCVTEPPAAENAAADTLRFHSSEQLRSIVAGERGIVEAPDLVRRARESLAARGHSAAHWHVAFGVAGHGPDGADGFARFGSLSAALEYARDLLGECADACESAAHGFGEREQYAEAWEQHLASDRLASLAANLDPARRDAPAYRDDPDAYAALEVSLAEQFPVDVSGSERLYLWECEFPAECEHDGEEG